jgi:hypothetical protein
MPKEYKFWGEEIKGYEDHKFILGEQGLMAECLSTLSQANARGLAKMAAFFANDGTLQGHQILKQETC